VARKLSTRSIVWLVLTGVLAGAGAMIWFNPSAPPGAASALTPAFDAQGHRGARGLFPENTLPGFAAALAIGVTTLEMDVGLSRDGVLVVHHDRKIDPQRTRGADGRWVEEPAPAIFALDSSALAAYDVGRARPDSRVAKRFPEQAGLDGVAIPTLAQVIVLAEAASNRTMRYNIEPKTAPDAPTETAAPEAIAEALAALIQDTGIAERAAIQSFDWRSLRRAQEIAPTIRTAYLTAEQSWLDNLQRGRPGISPWTAGIDVDDHEGSAPRTIKAAGGAVWSPYFRDLREVDLAEAKGLGLNVVVWTVNEPADMRSLIDLGVDGIITDYPDRLRAVMAERGLPLPPAFAAARPDD
jgi:glycerophosphoryl diester phosphodiesterase